MKLNNLRPASGSTKNKYRKGRGEGSGNGLTAGRGHKGAKSRSGYSRKIGFEGGQMPLQRRVPKFGFTNINRVSYREINLDTIQVLINENSLSGTINKDIFVKFGLASKKSLIKILGRGEINTAVVVEADKFTASAKNAIEKAGGTAKEVK